MDATAVFAATFAALYAGHHVGDYWVQTDHQARHKGDAGRAGAVQCLVHVLSYTAAQAVCLAMMATATGLRVGWAAGMLALFISGATHYAADRRERGLMYKLARMLPGKANFMQLGVPRGGHHDDNPTLGTGAWALDQSWHIFFGVFVPALLVAAFA